MTIPEIMAVERSPASAWDDVSSFNGLSSQKGGTSCHRIPLKDLDDTLNAALDEGSSTIPCTCSSNNSSSNSFGMWTDLSQSEECLKVRNYHGTFRQRELDRTRVWDTEDRLLVGFRFSLMTEQIASLGRLLVLHNTYGLNFCLNYIKLEQLLRVAIEAILSQSSVYRDTRKIHCCGDYFSLALTAAHEQYPKSCCIPPWPIVVCPTTLPLYGT